MATRDQCVNGWRTRPLGASAAAGYEAMKEILPTACCTNLVDMSLFWADAHGKVRWWPMEQLAACAHLLPHPTAGTDAQSR
jgi:hypothetical protein